MIEATNGQIDRDRLPVADEGPLREIYDRARERGDAIVAEIFRDKDIAKYLGSPYGTGELFECDIKMVMADAVRVAAIYSMRPPGGFNNHEYWFSCLKAAVDQIARSYPTVFFCLGSLMGTKCSLEIRFSLKDLNEKTTMPQAALETKRAVDAVSGV